MKARSSDVMLLSIRAFGVQRLQLSVGLHIDSTIETIDDLGLLIISIVFDNF